MEFFSGGRRLATFEEPTYTSHITPLHPGPFTPNRYGSNKMTIAAIYIFVPKNGLFSPQMEACVLVTHAPSTTAAATTAATSTSFATPSCPSSPPVGIGYLFIAAPPINIAAQPVEFSMTADSGASSHFIDNQPLPGIEHKMNHYVQLDPPVIINVARNHPLWRWSRGFVRSSVGPHRL